VKKKKIHLAQKKIHLAQKEIQEQNIFLRLHFSVYFPPVAKY
jgi:hypothetical protein